MIAKIDNNVYVARRRKLLEMMRAAGGGVAVLATADEQQRNRDNDFPFRPDSYFYYLTGFDEPQAVLVLRAGGEQMTSTLFCRAKDPAKEIWDGLRLGPQDAPKTLQLDEAYPVGELVERLSPWLINQPQIWWPFAVTPGLDTQISTLLGRTKQQARNGQCGPARAIDLCQYLDEQRLIKDEHEIRIMQAAANIAASAHQRAMHVCRPGMREYHLEAELLHEFRRHGSQYPAYTSIVASGANACILHYRAGDAELRDGELCLIDAGCELHMYASDITRTFPVNGRFSPAQRDLYDLVLAAQRAAMQQVKAGNRFTDPHEAATNTLIEGMLALGLLDSNEHGKPEDVLRSGAYKQFYMHRTGHWLGMDVHDCGDYGEGPPAAGSERPSRLLQAGMVLTVEPGIYVRPDPKVPEKYWNIGIRIEDDALVTAKGAHVLSADIPVSAKEIETIMRP